MFWLASYGTLPTITESGLKFSQQKKANPDISVSPEELIHRRLSNRFRHESCVLAAKRLKDRYSPAKVDPRKSRWLRETCRKAMSLGVKDLL
ncbi:hypothetical protein PNOK_0552300 [Pyrrhoderma noxium]|uniref:Uncharacterized protein n=1 Tax=Pyrrhoderma noxium TaxID=2282107 RepID=A0A286UGE9_9AGAM|nr:hypothetical protein PNOK_0552300 [Pyrrhoderma noxium]